MIIPSLESYEEMTDAVLAWTADWIDDLEFDRLAMAFEPEKCFGPRTSETLLLPSFARNPGGQRADFIMIAQNMWKQGFLERREEGEERVFYRRKKEQQE